MTKKDIINGISKDSGIDRNTVSLIIELFMKYIKLSLIEKKERIFLRGFGTFSLKKRRERTGRDILRNTKIIIPPHEVPNFKPSENFLRLEK